MRLNRQCWETALKHTETKFERASIRYLRLIKFRNCIRRKTITFASIICGRAVTLWSVNVISNKGNTLYRIHCVSYNNHDGHIMVILVLQMMHYEYVISYHGHKAELNKLYFIINIDLFCNSSIIIFRYN